MTNTTRHTAIGLTVTLTAIIAGKCAAQFQPAIWAAQVDQILSQRIGGQTIGVLVAMLIVNGTMVFLGRLWECSVRNRLHRQYQTKRQTWNQTVQRLNEVA